MNKLTKIASLSLMGGVILGAPQAYGMERLSQLWAQTSWAISQRATPLVMKRVAMGSGLGVVAGLLMRNPYMAGISGIGSFASLYVSRTHNPVVKDFQRQANDALLHNKNFLPILQRLKSSHYDRNILDTVIVPAIHQRAQQLTLEIQNKLETHSPQEVIALYLNNKNDTRINDLRDLNKCNNYNQYYQGYCIRDYYEQVLAPVRLKSKELMHRLLSNLAADVQAGNSISQSDYRKRYEQLLSDDKRIFRHLLDHTIPPHIISRAPVALEKNVMDAFNNKHGLENAIKSYQETMRDTNEDYDINLLFEKYASIIHPVAHQQTEQIIAEIEVRFEQGETPRDVARTVSKDSRYQGFSLPALEPYQHKIDVVIQEKSKTLMFNILNDLAQDLNQRDEYVIHNIVAMNFLNKTNSLLEKDCLQARKLFKRALDYRHTSYVDKTMLWIKKYITHASSIKDFPKEACLWDCLKDLARNKFDQNMRDALSKQIMHDFNKYIVKNHQQESYDRSLFSKLKAFITLFLTQEQKELLSLIIRDAFEQELAATEKPGTDYSYTLTWNKTLEKWTSIHRYLTLPSFGGYSDHRSLEGTYIRKISSLTNGMREADLKALLQQYRSLATQGYSAPQEKMYPDTSELKSYIDMMQLIILDTVIVPAIHQRAQQLTLEIQNKLETHSPQEVIALYLNNKNDTRLHDLLDLNKCNNYYQHYHRRDYYEQVLAPVRLKSKELMQQFVSNLAADVQAGNSISQSDYRKRYEQLLSDDKRFFRHLLDHTIPPHIISRAPVALEKNVMDAFNNKHGLENAIKSYQETMRDTNEDYDINLLFEKYASIIHPVAHQQTEQIIAEIEVRFEQGETPRDVARTISKDSRYQGFSLPALEPYQHKIDVVIQEKSKTLMFNILNDLAQELNQRDEYVIHNIVAMNFLNKTDSLLKKDCLQARKLFKQALDHRHTSSVDKTMLWIKKYITQASSIKDFPKEACLWDCLKDLARNKFDQNMRDALNKQIMREFNEHIFGDSQQHAIPTKQQYYGDYERWKNSLFNKLNDFIRIFLTPEQKEQLSLRIRDAFEQELAASERQGSDYTYTLTWNKALNKWKFILWHFGLPFFDGYSDHRSLEGTYMHKISSLAHGMREADLKALLQQYRSLVAQGYSVPQGETYSDEPELKPYIHMMQLIITAGINPYAQDKSGRNAFDYAEGDTMLIDMLLDTHHIPPMSKSIVSDDSDHAPTMLEAFLDHHHRRGAHSKEREIFTWLGDPQNIRLLAMERRERQFTAAPKNAPEKAEYCVFYHAHHGMLRIFQDIARHVFEFEHQVVAQDFIPLRFWHDAQGVSHASQFIISKGLDKGTALNGINDNMKGITENILAVNLSFFGNSYTKGESTMWYYKDNRSIARNSLNGLLERIFNYYDFDISKMEDVCRCAQGTLEKGSVVQIFIPRKYVNRVVYLAEPWGLPYKTDLGFEGFEMCGSVKSQQKITPIIDSIRRGTFVEEINKRNFHGPYFMNVLQARIVLGKDVMLNGKSGVKIFRNDNLSATDAKKYSKDIADCCRLIFIDWLERILQQNPDGTCGVKQEALDRIKDTPLGKLVQDHDRIHALLQKLRAEAQASASENRQSKL